MTLECGSAGALDFALLVLGGAAAHDVVAGVEVGDLLALGDLGGAARRLGEQLALQYRAGSGGRHGRVSFMHGPDQLSDRDGQPVWCLEEGS